MDDDDEYDNTHTHVYDYATVFNVFGVDYLDGEFDELGDYDGDE